MTIEIALRHRLGAFALDIAFSAPNGIVTLFGRSGAGKTTIVDAVAGLLVPDSGRIVVDGEVLLDTARGVCLPPHRRRVGYVFQEGRLFPHMTVRQNLGYGRRFAAERPTDAEVRRVTGLLGLDPLLDRRPGRLSGGEKQRVAIGRALLAGPRILLMDEPLAALDEARKQEILPYVERLRDEMRLPVLYVSHSVPEVARLADTIVVVADGRVAHAGPARAVLSDPDAIPSLGVREAGAVLDARVVGHDPADGLTELEVSAGRLFVPLIDAAQGVTLRLRVDAGDVVLARTRPEGLSALNILPVTVAAVREGHGPGAAVSLRVGDDMMLARITRRSVRMLGLAPGLACFAVVKSLQVTRADIGA